MSVICSHLKLGHNFLESFLSRLTALLDFFYKDSPRRRACFLNSVFDCSPFRNSKNFQIFGCACPRIELIRRCQTSRKFVVLGSLPRVLSYTDQIDGGNGGSLQVRRKASVPVSALEYCPILLIHSHDHVSECSMIGSNCRAVKYRFSHLWFYYWSFYYSSIY